MKLINVVGGLGSQMMAYALSLALKKNYPNERVVCDFTAYIKYGRVDHNGPELHRVFGIPLYQSPLWIAPIVHSKQIPAKLCRALLRKLQLLRYHTAQSNRYNYDPSVFSQRGLVIYEQCWTSWKYFLSVDSDIRKVFTFPHIKGQQNADALKEIESTNSVAIHIRRGDYVHNPVLGNLVGMDYYRRAIAHIAASTSQPHFFLFSDDLAWVQHNLLKEIQQVSTVISWNKAQSSYLDMHLMSRCRHHIIPNSSFSWWGAYLAKHPSQVVITPKTWSNPSTGIDLMDMNLPDWVEISNVTG